MKYFVPTKISDNIHETPEGFLICVAVPIARTGSQEYAQDEVPLDSDDNGMVIVNRDASEVFDPKTIASFEGKAFTIKHPEVFVDPSNWKTLAKGHMQNVRKGADKDEDGNEMLIADVLITDSTAISLVKNGMRGLSCGYEAEYVQTGPGKGKQVKIIGNHLALVDEGRAGAEYEIRDHSKGDSQMPKMNKSVVDKIKAAFTKTLDEAVVADEDVSAPVVDKAAYDELVKMCADMKKGIDALMAKGKDADPDEDKVAKAKAMAAAKAKKEGEGEDADVNAGLEDRLKALETAVQQILEGMSDDGDDTGDEDDMDDVGDEDGDDEETGDEDDPSMVGDTASRAEILSPGIKITKDVKVKALKAAYGTKDGKIVIDQLTGKKAPAYDDAAKVNSLFRAASELMKVTRKNALVRTKTGNYKPTIFNDESHMSAEKMNEINKKFYQNK